MPNIRQLISIKEQYDSLTQSDKYLKEFLNKELLETVSIQKSFSFTNKLILEHFDAVNNVPGLIKYFESKPKEDVVLLFIDITGFSNLTEKRSSQYITSYLDNYYKAAFPIIYKYGGQIEKLMGDGIICVFGKPFINVDWYEEFNRAEECAKELISKFKGTNKELKAALHSGEVTYYKTPGIDYEEYTMVGKPITELYRLESVSRKNAINFYTSSIYDSICPFSNLGFSRIKKYEVKTYRFEIELTGVKYNSVRYLKFN